MTRDKGSSRNTHHDALSIGRLLADRLCHDLSSLAGTVSNALALADEDLASRAEAAAVGRAAADALASRLQFLRAAWGTGGEGMTLPEFRILARGLPGRRVNLDLTAISASQEIGPAVARLLCNLLILGAESLPEGGVIELRGDVDGDVIVLIEGPRGAWPGGFAGFLADEAAAWDQLAMLADSGETRCLQAPLTALLARQAGASLSLLMSRPGTLPPPLLLDLRGIVFG